MSKIIKITDHQQALSKYLDELLIENDTIAQLKSPSRKNIDWTSQPFDALLIDIQGLQLAIPTHLIDSIAIWSEKKASKKAEDKPNWYLDHHKTDQYDINIVDLKQIILPPKLQSTFSPAEFIIIIADQKWGLSCNKINNVVTLLPRTITWRKKAGNRPWLAGIALEKKYSILNIEALVEQLEAESINL